MKINEGSMWPLKNKLYTMKESFLIYKSLYGPLKTLSLEEKGLLFEAIFTYQIEGVVPDLPPVINMAFQFVKDQFDRDDNKYNKKCDRNHRNGSKGGRPGDETNNPEDPANPNKTNGLKSTPSNPTNPFNPTKPKKPTGLKLTQPYPKNPTKPDTDTDTDSETDSENDKKTIKVFKVFYSCYPGTKRSPGTEYENFMKQNRKNKDKIIHLLLPALEKEKQFRINSFELNSWIPAWKNLSTWIREKCWEQEFSELRPAIHLNGKSQTVNEVSLKTPDKW